VSARATPFAVPLRRPLAIGGDTVAARYGMLVELGEELAPRARAPLDGPSSGGLAEVAWLPRSGMPDWSDARAARIGLEAAELDRVARRRGQPLADALGGVRRTRIALNALLTERAPERCAAEGLAYVAAGFRCLKLKLTPRDLAGDCQRLRALRAALGPDIALRVDANAAWSVDDAIAALHVLAPFDLEYVEQPVAAIAELAAVRRAVPMRVAADESLTGATALGQIIAAQAADVVVLKPTLIGLRESVALAARAHAAGLGVVVTSGLDTTLGIAAAAHVAAAIEAPLLPCGLATAELLAGDLALARLAVETGELILPLGPGLGVELDRAALDRWRLATSFALDERAPQRGAPGSPGEATARTHGDRIALQCGAAAWTFAELARRAGAIGAHLVAHGIGAGDHVALLLTDRLAFAAWLHGITRIGAVALPLGERLTAGELARQLDACPCRATVTDAGLAPLAATLPAHQRGVLLDAADYRDDASPYRGVAPPHEAPHTVVFTSGSTGAPKAVLLTHRNHLASAVGAALALGVRDDDRWLACLPLHHVGGLAILMRSVVSAVPVVLHGRFDPVAVNDAIDAERITLVSLVAAMLQQLLDTRGARPFPATLRWILLGGGPAPQALLDECRRRSLPVALTYGMTETASQLVTNGIPLLGAGVRIMRDGMAVGEGQTGLIEASGPMISPGYLRDAALVAAGTWLRTRDLGRFAADGRLEIVGRADDMLISGGENVHPREVELALEAHPAVAEACVFGLPDPAWGERVAAWVRPRAGQRIDAAALARYARTRLAGFKVPRRIEVVADFPRTAAGKIVRRAVRDAALGTSCAARGGP